MERERAREFYWNDTDTRHAGLTTQNAESVIDLMEAYATERVREELEAACRAVCVGCLEDVIIVRENFHQWGTGGIAKCNSTNIRKRLAELTEAASEEPN